MSNNNMSGQPFGYYLGSILERRKKTDKKQLKDVALATIGAEFFSAYQKKLGRNLSEEIESYKDAYIPVFKNIEINFENAQKTKQDLLEYDRNPEIYINKRIANDFEFSDFAQNNNITRQDLGKIKGTKYEKGYQDWVTSQRERIVEEMELRKNNPYVQATSYEELAGPVVAELKGKIRELENDPSKTSVLMNLFKKVFGKKESSQVAMEVDMEDYMIESKKLDESYTNFKSDLNNFYKKKATGDKAPWMGFFTGKPVYDKYFKNIDKDQKNLIESNFEDIADNEYQLPLYDNPEQTVSSTPFDELDEIKVMVAQRNTDGTLVLENGKPKYIEDKNSNAKTELAKYISYLSAFQQYNQENDPNNLIPDLGIIARNKKSVEELIAGGYLTKESKNGSVVFKVPIDLGRRMEFENIDPETLDAVTSMVNEAEGVMSENALNLEETYKQYLNDRIANRRKEGLDTSVEQNKLSQASEKDYVAGQLEFLFNPPEELIGQSVMLGDKAHKLGTMTESQKKRYYESYQNDFGVRNEVLDKLLGLGDEPFKEATETEFNEMNKAQQNIYNMSINKRLNLLEELESPDISLARQDRLREMIRETETGIAGLIENRGTTTIGRVVTGLSKRSELGRIEADIKNTEERLENRRALTPKQIQDTEDRLRQLKQRKQELELSL
jgi:hypothetical protein